MEKKHRIAVILVVLALAIFIVNYLTRPSEEYPYTALVSDVPVKSKIPLDSLQNWVSIGLAKSEDPAIIACNLELSAISGGSDPRGYMVKVEYGEPGIIVKNAEATISGKTQQDLLYVCHAFSCLKSGITCPGDFSEIQRIMWDTNHINVIINENMSGEATRAYAELLGPLGYYQSQRVDSDGDGQISRNEIDNNRVFIYPYIRYNDTCVLQPLNNIIQKLNAANQSRDCDISPGIYLEESNRNEITVEGGKIFLRGDATALQIESIIVGNIIAPEWILKFRGVI